MHPARRDALRRDVLHAAGALMRDLPWRATRDPWHVLVSEVMLQQTQAQRVVEPFLRFVARFPTPGACASARVKDVVGEWAGLGYNRRALYLHRAAGALVARHGGVVPADLTALRALPGVGPYTARAVLAFAYEQPVGAVDTNVRRVLSRAVAGRSLADAEAQTVADELVPPLDAWRFNQALFDIGARHCKSRHPSCSGCPLRHRCRWSRGGSAPPDPGAPVRRQSRFDGSDRQGRGRLVGALRAAPVPAAQLGAAAGWPEDASRARRIADGLVAEGMAGWADGELMLA